jgi:hypothetical protein
MTPALAGAVDGLATAGTVEGGGVPGMLAPGWADGVEMQPDSTKRADTKVAATDRRTGLPLPTRRAGSSQI